MLPLGHISFVSGKVGEGSRLVVRALSGLGTAHHRIWVTIPDLFPFKDRAQTHFLRIHSSKLNSVPSSVYIGWPIISSTFPTI